MIQVGCCGFPVKRSLYYETFPVVEIQQTFYQLPRMITAGRWREEAPSGFEFTMKAWQLITHEPSNPTYRRLKMAIPEEKKKNYGFFKRTEEIEVAWAKTAEFARALGARIIVFQSPSSFFPSDDHIRNIKGFFHNIDRNSFTLIWEPRGKWDREQVESICMESGVIPCLDPFGEARARGDLLHLRLHGRRGYHYTYAEAELKKLIETGKEYHKAYFMFNNTNMYEDACRLRKFLEGAEDPLSA